MKLYVMHLLISLRNHVCIQGLTIGSRTLSGLRNTIRQAEANQRFSIGGDGNIQRCHTLYDYCTGHLGYW